jgi:hypothetical protein
MVDMYLKLIGLEASMADLYRSYSYVLKGKSPLQKLLKMQRR